MAKLIELIEYAPASAVTLSDLELNELRLENQHWKHILGLARPPLAIAPNGQNEYSIRAEGVTGVISTAHLKVEVQPKFLGETPNPKWQQILWNILISSGDVPKIRSSISATESIGDLTDIVGQVFLTSLASASDCGLPRGYVEYSKMLPILRGKLDIKRLISSFSSPGLLPCTYEELDYDIPINRLLFWACRTLAFGVQSRQLSDRLKHESLAFKNVSLVLPSPADCENSRLQLLQKGLEPALAISKLLARNRVSSPSPGAFSSPSFLWNSAKVFENMTNRILVLLAKVDGWQVSRGSAPLAKSVADGSSLVTNPDFRLSKGGFTYFVLDSKYKVTEYSGQPSAPDVYQVMAGSRLYSCDMAILVYPSSKPKPNLEWRIYGDQFPRRLFATYLDLSVMTRPSNEYLLVADLRGLLLAADLD